MSGIAIPKGYALRQMTTPEEQDKKLKEVAEMYEKHFLRELVKSMRGTVHEGGFIHASQGEKIFREQLDEQYVDKWGEKGGVGLGALIHKQLLTQFGEQMGIRPPTDRLHGPVAIKSADRLEAAADAGAARSGTATTAGAPGAPGAPGVRAGSGDSGKFGFRSQVLPSRALRLQFSNFTGEPAEVKSPWAGILTDAKQDEHGKMLLGIDHANGFRSEMRFNGEWARHLQPGVVMAGETLGLWTPSSESESQEMEWRLQPLLNKR